MTLRSAWLAVIVAARGFSGFAQQTAPARAARPQEPAHARPPVMTWRLNGAEQRYATIDPAKLMQLVEAQTAMSRKYRDSGHPQFWGRITGTEADTENAQWLMAKFRELGLTDIREQVFDLQPQWMPQSWSVVASTNGKTLKLETTQPTYLAVGTHGDVDLEAVYVGMASDADLALSKDVKGKAAFFYSTDTSSRHVGVQDNAIRRLTERGAAAIFVIQGLPGNMRTQFYPVNSTVPTFTMGQREGLALRDFLALSNEPTRVKVNLDVQNVPGLKSRTVWATLPGMTDENIVVVAHRDGWFEGANDNAAGVATALGIAEFFSKIPKEERKRTIIFAGTTGHHDNGAESGMWFTEHPEFFAKTAVLLNAEHTGAAQTGTSATRVANGTAASTWFASGNALADIVAKAMDGFGVVSYPQSSGSPAGEIGRYHQFAPAMQIMTSGFTWHSDEETAAQISPTGLAAITRTYAKVMMDSNALTLQQLRTNVAAAPTR
jgi:hypothetical protein